MAWSLNLETEKTIPGKIPLSIYRHPVFFFLEFAYLPTFAVSLTTFVFSHDLTARLTRFLAEVISEIKYYLVG